jgi:hypothetical protein
VDPGIPEASAQDPVLDVVEAQERPTRHMATSLEELSVAGLPD